MLRRAYFGVDPARLTLHQYHALVKNLPKKNEHSELMQMIGK